MIRINLLPHKKKKRKAAPIEGEQTVAIGLGIVMAFAAGLYFFVHNPQQEEITTAKRAASKLNKDNQVIENKTKSFDADKAAIVAAEKQAVSIEQLNQARATPANFLFELATILKQGGKVSMTKEMVGQLKNNKNLQWDGWEDGTDDWDPKNVWINSLKESGGTFTLVGSAKSDSDATQLTARLTASMYFDDVKPESSSKKKSDAGGATIYGFKITGKVRY